MANGSRQQRMNNWLIARTNNENSFLFLIFVLEIKKQKKFTSNLCSKLISEIEIYSKKKKNYQMDFYSRKKSEIEK